MQFRSMIESDIPAIAHLYMDHYNTYESGAWTEATTCKRIHQVWSHEDALCLILENNHEILGFCIGHFEQYDDLKAYDLVEIVISHPYQNQGIGTQFMLELEHRVKEQGGAMIQLQSVNDSLHEVFYGKLSYQTCNNLVLKSKFLL